MRIFNFRFWLSPNSQLVRNHRTDPATIYIYIYTLKQSGRRATVINKSLFAIDLGEIDRWYFILPRIWSSWLASLFLGINATQTGLSVLHVAIGIYGSGTKYRFYGPTRDYGGGTNASIGFLDRIKRCISWMANIGNVRLPFRACTS